MLLPVDLHPRLFSQRGFGALAPGERRCDLVLFALKRNIVEATFAEVKWRRGRAPLQELADDMVLQMAGSTEALRARFFDADRVDGALQRAYLANVLRFYFERAKRYDLFGPAAGESFLEHLARLEKTGLQFRHSYEGCIVSLDREPHRPFQFGEAKITVLTAADFESATEFTATRSSFTTVPDDARLTIDPAGPGDDDPGEPTASDLPNGSAEPIRTRAAGRGRRGTRAARPRWYRSASPSSVSSRASTGARASPAPGALAPGACGA